mgnify:CR=1 FL=1
MINFGNWLRKVCPWTKKNPEYLVVEEEWTTIDHIVYSVVSGCDLVRDKYDKGLVLEFGDLTVKQHINSRYAHAEYKGKDLGFFKNPVVLDLVREKYIAYCDKQYEASEASRVKRQQEREEFLKQVLKEVSKDVS